ncbi:hypothetical protein PC9H_004346 [Pleurotus ostreatus]|uniref:Uncharacterized protein n=1 Tax=Pleurotus ostreatus TaxID=5322 RepID=A0A8H7A7I7_PLEOS|nr:uncharacterized protein PC9H_004346 [Pleurotus ostreatus]KAF7437505.1 hypothetical protein PC9H_004346 [Pleurotus ostreatus]
MFAETFYDGFVHSTEQLLRESLVHQAQRHSPVLELQDFCFGVGALFVFHNITSTRVFRTLRTTSARKLQDLQRKVDFITGKLDRASEKQDVPRQTRNSKVQAIKQNLDEQLLLGRVVKDLATTAKPKDKQKGAVSTPAPARKPKQKDDKATPRPTPDAESISTAPKRKGRPPKISRNVQPIRAISPTSAYRGGTGKNAALLENTLRATAVMNNAMAPPPAPAPTMLHLEVPSGSGRKVNPTPKAEELMQTRARAKARVEKKAVGSLTKDVGMSTRSLTGKAGPSTPTPQPLVRKRKLGD